MGMRRNEKSMAGIYLSGGAGTGKTTFCNVMQSQYGISLITDVIRGIHKRHPYISDLPTNERQLIYATEYLKIHHVNEPERFLSDRSLLNVLAFWKMEPEIVHYLGLKNRGPDLLILLPVPTYKWYVDHIDYFLDAIRIETYKQRAGFPKDELTHPEIASLFYEQDRDMYTRMKSMCDYLDWRHFIPEFDRSDCEYFQANWQEQAHEVIVDLWKIKNPKTIVKVRELGGDIDGTQSTSTED
jgi:hypothetical protein